MIPITALSLPEKALQKGFKELSKQRIHRKGKCYTG
jgi:hypothetical protein